MQTTRTGTPNFSIQSLRSGDNLSELVHKVGHDIGNPLTAIISVCSIIQTMAEMDSAGLVPKVSEYAGMLTGEAWKISRINERLVGLLSNRKPNLVPCNIHNNFLTVFNRLQSRDQKKLGKLEIEFNPVSKCDKIAALADNNQLNLLITELIINCGDALEKDYSLHKKKNPKISVNIFEDTNRACFSVASEISFRCEVENLGDLFNPFVTVGYPEEKKIGLGLTTALAATERMQGQIELSEQKEADNLFCFSATVRLPSVKL